MTIKLIYFCVILFLFSCKKEEEIVLDSAKSGGDATIYTVTSDVFTSPAPNLNTSELELHLEGDVNFERKFVPSGNPLFPGLGPIFNNNLSSINQNKVNSLDTNIL